MKQKDLGTEAEKLKDLGWEFKEAKVLYKGRHLGIEIYTNKNKETQIVIYRIREGGSEIKIKEWDLIKKYAEKIEKKENEKNV